jgi:hypothetical protein
VGEFDQENELCTVKGSLAEAIVPKSPSLLHRAKVALRWALFAYPVALGGVLLMSLCALSAFQLRDRLAAGTGRPSKPTAGT